MHIETLTTCHNRRAITTRVLADLYAQKLPPHTTIEHTLVDDGSTDGTTSAVQNHFPQVNIVQGNGRLFWAGGMRYGYENQIKSKKFDYLFVYNDDVRLEDDAIARLLDAAQKFIASEGRKAHVVAGTFLDKSGNFSYGGVSRCSYWHPLRFRLMVPPEAGYIFVDSLNMNACLISYEAIHDVGFLSSYFIHNNADFEFGLKLRKSGGYVILCSGVIGSCEKNSKIGTSSELAICLRDRYRRLLSVKEQPVRQRFILFKNYGGKLWFFLFLSPYLTMLIRHLWWRICIVIKNPV